MINLTLILNTVVLVVLIYLSGRFSGSEIALTSITKSDLAQMKMDDEKNVEMIDKLKNNMDKTIVTILIGNNLFNIVASSLTTRLSYSLFGNLGVSISIGLLTFFILVFGEIVPKNFAIKNKKPFARNNAKMIYYLSLALSPVVSGLESLSNEITAALGGKTESEGMEIEEKDVKRLGSILEEEGVIKKVEKDILHRVFWFGDQTVETVKIPTSEVSTLTTDSSVEDAVESIRNSNFTRTPVIDPDSKDVEGILYVKDILGKDEGAVKDYMREPEFIRNDEDITDVFNWMRKNRIHMAMVQSEDGKLDGVITLEDILEELLGEIYDEFD